MAKNKLGQNPVEAHRKAQRAKEAKKNAEQRKKARETTYLKKDTGGIDAEIRRLQAEDRAGGLDAASKARLAELEVEVGKIKAVKDAYLEAHPEHRGLVYKERPKVGEASGSGSGSGAGAAAAGRYDSKGRLRDPKRSVYYDPVLNPFGVPPPGMPYKERPLAPGEDESDSDDESDDDIIMPEGPPPGESEDESESDSDDSIVMPEGPPPPSASARPPQPPAGPPSGAQNGMPMPPGPPPGPPPGGPPMPMQMQAYPGQPQYPMQYPPGPPPFSYGMPPQSAFPPQQQPHFNAWGAAGPPPGPPAGFYPPTGPPAHMPHANMHAAAQTSFSAPPAPAPAPFLPPRDRQVQRGAAHDPLSDTPNKTFQAHRDGKAGLPSKPIKEMSEEEKKAAAAAATISAEPQLRDLRKEAATFVPRGLKRKKEGKGGAGDGGGAAAGPAAQDEEDDEPRKRASVIDAAPASAGSASPQSAPAPAYKPSGGLLGKLNNVLGK